MAFKIQRKRKVNTAKVIAKTAVALITIYVGGLLLDAIGNIIENTESAYWGALTIIGYSVGERPLFDVTHYANECGNLTNSTSATAPGITTCVSSADSTGGILGLIPIAIFASVIMEFVRITL